MTDAAHALFERNLSAHRRVFAQLDGLADDIAKVGAHLADTLLAGGRLLFFGNGGSASDSMHIAAELSGRLRHERRALPALALNADAAAMTAIANDYGYAEVFARLLAAQAKAGDCAIGLSTSGRSANVLRAFETAQAMGVSRVALLGRDGGPARALADLAVVVPDDDSARVQEAHIFIGHTWCGQIEMLLGLVPAPAALA